MRIMLVTALAMSLAGCSGIDFYGDEPAPRETATEAAPAVDPAAEAVDVAALPPAEPGTVATASSPSTAAAPGVQPSPPPSIARSTAPSVHCTELAKLRTRDAAYGGEDEATQDSVYRRTYADCVAWETRHRS
jgi:hypothetical protein